MNVVVSGRHVANNPHGTVESFRALIDTPSKADDFFRDMGTDPRVKKIVYTIMSRAGVPFEQEPDFSQVLAMRMWDLAKRGKVSDPSGFYKLLYTVAIHVAKEIMRVNTHHKTLSLEDDVDLDEVLGADFSSLAENSIDTSNAKRKIRRYRYQHPKDERMPPVTTVGLPIEVGGNDKQVVLPSPPSRRAKRKLSPETTELIEIRDSMGMTIDEFCECLGLGTPRMYSYLYGRVTPPMEIMAAARNLLGTNKSAVDEVKRMFRRAPADIVREWIKMIGADKENDSDAIAMLSGVIDVHPLTIRRWMTGEIGLSPPRARVYHGRLVEHMMRVS